MLLKGHLISLRALEPDDLEALYTWENNPAVWHLSNTVAPFSKYILSEYIKNAAHDIYTNKQLRLMICHDKEPIGTIDLFDFDPINQRAGIGILIADEHQRGKGFAKDALQVLCHYCFSVLYLHQLYCNINANNPQSIALFKGAGFEETGIKKQWNKMADTYIDELFFQLINPHHI